jgi:hypothetical protein
MYAHENFNLLQQIISRIGVLKSLDATKSSYANYSLSGVRELTDTVTLSFLLLFSFSMERLSFESLSVKRHIETHINTKSSPTTSKHTVKTKTNLCLCPCRCAYSSSSSCASPPPPHPCLLDCSSCSPSCRVSSASSPLPPLDQNTKSARRT